MTITSDEGFAITGYGTVSGSNTDAFLIKTNSAGTVQWSFRYGDSRAEVGNCVKQTSDGGFIIGGTQSSRATYGNQFYLVKTNSDGNSGTCETAVTTTTASVTFSNSAATLNTTAATEGVSSSSSTRTGRASSLFKLLDCNYNVLPVELLSFSGTYSNRKTHLYWSTASELNNDYFTIERSDDGKNFQEIGTVDGAGNSSIIRNYKFEDSEIPPSVGGRALYYRLKQTDYDGQFSYSDILSVKLEPVNGITVHSNATNEQLLISFSDELEGKSCSIKIYDLSGRICFTCNFLPATNKKEMWIDCSNWSNGVYIISVEGDGKIYPQKFAKQ